MCIGKTQGFRELSRKLREFFLLPQKIFEFLPFETVPMVAFLKKSQSDVCFLF